MSNPDNLDNEFLEERKVTALEKIADNLSDLVLWFEEIDKDEWSERVQYYLAEFHKFKSDDGKQTGDSSSLSQ